MRLSSVTQQSTSEGPLTLWPGAQPCDGSRTRRRTPADATTACTRSVGRRGAATIRTRARYRSSHRALDFELARLRGQRNEDTRPAPRDRSPRDGRPEEGSLGWKLVSSSIVIPCRLIEWQPTSDISNRPCLSRLLVSLPQHGFVPASSSSFCEGEPCRVIFPD